LADAGDRPCELEVAAVAHVGLLLAWLERDLTATVDRALVAAPRYDDRAAFGLLHVDVLHGPLVDALYGADGDGDRGAVAVLGLAVALEATASRYRRPQRVRVVQQPPDVVARQVQQLVALNLGHSRPPRGLAAPRSPAHG
jgi:hypothetical protein